MPIAPGRIEERLRERFPGVEFPRAQAPAMRDVTWMVPADRLVEVCAFLRDDPEFRFEQLSWISGIDWLPREPRFEVVYNLLSVRAATRVTLKVALPGESPRVPTVTGVWPGANWLERETYDFYGIEFTGHPNLTRILLPESWEGWPLRKDSPLGYEEVAFTHNTPNRRAPSPQLRKLAPRKVRYRAQ
jgi:NADH-quinone oxidoreductase subunit C